VRSFAPVLPQEVIVQWLPFPWKAVT